VSETSPTPRNKGLKRIVNAFFHSSNGLKTCFQKEEAFRQEIFLAIILIPLALWIGDDTVEKLLLIGSVFLVLITEILNSAVERAIDRISFERHELSKEAKDMGSAAVMLSVMLAVIVWAAIILF
jgi:diacylglycerol kinase (ATP)